jgi:hypothetical protein
LVAAVAALVVVALEVQAVRVLAVHHKVIQDK